jgi:colanic acid/amylovoran biosynthesis glycosyltransferase
LNNTLHFFTNGFPYGKGEQFIADEIPCLAKSFDKVIIYVSPKFGLVSPLNYELPDNFEVLCIDFDKYIKQRSIFIPTICLLLREILFSNKRLKYLKELKKHWFWALEIVERAKTLNTILEQNQSLICYTYWFDQWTTILGAVKRFYKKDIKIISRAHGFDLDVRQVPRGYFPFRKSTLKKLDKVVAISEVGKRLLQKDNSLFKAKINKQYLGVTLFGECDKSQIKENEYLVVSCATLISIKQVDKIVTLLSQMKQPIRWVHFGAGPLEKEIKKQLTQLPKNIQSDFYGQVTNDVILNFYSDNWVDTFIHLSKLEGIPVALMEAGAFGIPLMAYDTGGVSELVNKETGILLTGDIEEKQYPNLLAQQLQEKGRNESFRKGVSSFVKRNFNASKNHQEFIQQYLQ